MKKCPECGNPSYDGAPVCGNCGYVFPKPKVSAPKGKDIFEKDSKVKETSKKESTSSLTGKHKVIIGAIILITLIVICGIVLTGGSNKTSTPLQTAANVAEYNDNGFSFSYPQDWKEANYTDSDHEDAIFFEKGDVILEFYNVTSDYSNLKEVTLDRIDNAQDNGAYVELVETITLDGRNGSNIVFENEDGDYTRYVSLLSDGKLYVFRVMGDSFNSVTSGDVDSTINTAHIA